ncbi:MAG: SEC-C metal-binding domain-containing protein [Beijerinckiaceae bacterium]
MLTNSQSAGYERTVLPLGPERQAAAQRSGPAAISGKVGRNDPCPCRSPKEFKKCCLQSASPGSDRPVKTTCSAYRR